MSLKSEIMATPVTIEKLISGHIVEIERIEYKNGLNIKRLESGSYIPDFFAFANDFEIPEADISL